MDITKNIKALRESKGFSQGKMAELLQMERANYHRLENRNTKMSIDQLQSIADALGVSLGELLGIEGKEAADEAGKIKELEKELVYYKTLYIHFEGTQTSLREVIEMMIHTKISTLAHDLEMGTCVLRDKESGTTFKFKGEKALSTFLEQNPELKEGLENGSVSFKIEYTDKELHTIWTRLIETNYEYWQLLYFLDYIKDPKFRELIKEYQFRSPYLSYQTRL